MQKILIIAAIILIAFSCKSKVPINDTIPNTLNPEAIITQDFAIGGMTCTGCENTIKSAISILPGVVEVSASYKEGTATVKFDTTQTKFMDISKAISDKGYTPLKRTL